MNVKGRLRGKSPLGGLLPIAGSFKFILRCLLHSQAESVFVRWKVFKHIDIKIGTCLNRRSVSTLL